MNFAVITDIHGNAQALRAVLNEIDKRNDIEHIFCLGDMIAIGPDTNEVLSQLFSRNDISIVTGNHDEAVLALVKGEAHPKSHEHTKTHHQWIADRIDESFVSLLDTLPRIIRKEIEGHSVLFTHYHINKEKLTVPINEDPFSKIVAPTLENLELLFEGEEESLICFGHHHPLHYFHGKHTIFVNPGSLGCSNKSTAPYAIISVKKSDISVIFKEVSYDNHNFLTSYKKLQVPDRDFILKVFHGNQL